MEIELEIPLPGVEGKLDYVSNQFLKVGSFGVKTENYDALIVGTTEAEKYNLYIFDNMVGGAPQEADRALPGCGTREKCPLCAQHLGIAN